MSKGESSSTLNMARFIYLSDISNSRFPLLIYCCPLKVFLIYFFCLFTASELAKTPRKSVSSNLKSDSEITIDIPQCSKGKILLHFFKESFHSCFKVMVCYFTFLSKCIFIYFLLFCSKNSFSKCS